MLTNAWIFGKRYRTKFVVLFCANFQPRDEYALSYLSKEFFKREIITNKVSLLVISTIWDDENLGAAKVLSSLPEYLSS